jgi:hypothetical protein
MSAVAIELKPRPKIAASSISMMERDFLLFKILGMAKSANG